ncbi:MAG TPA: selenide, water dikinase SelD [Acetobacteraceae bacterium]|jgi:selenide,water dikinase|nr:selenide, water dikinase SelD [Acetobacteraceae bacterium]
MADIELRLTSLAHGGGCGCKLSPAVLREILANMPAAASFPNLLVGTETGDDAAVWRLNDTQALVATTDFFTPIVDDPYDFGRIAATNALSDVYAMGGSPILALAIVGMPLGKLPVEMMQAIIAGGAATCAAAGIPVAGGHSIDIPEPVYGLVALGLVHPDHVLRNSGACDGDVLILAKGLGIGIYSAALKQGKLAPCHYAAMLGSTTQLNTLGRALPEIAGVHAVTDVTGFGLLGHALEICRGSKLGGTVRFDDVPLLDGVVDLVQAGFNTGAAGRNWASYGEDVDLPAALPEWRRALLCDPQTSGGLLIAASPDAAQTVITRAHEEGFVAANIVGTLRAGEPRVRVA